jgi:hypothetical protein
MLRELHHICTANNWRLKEVEGASFRANCVFFSIHLKCTLVLRTAVSKADSIIVLVPLVLVLLAS